MIPFTNEDGLRDFRRAAQSAPRPPMRWPWLILVLVLTAGLGVAFGAWR